MKEKSSLPPLPRRTVKYVVNPDDMNEAAARGMLSNPVYVGVPPYNRVVSDEAWVRAAVKLIEEDGPEQFLVNLLYMLRISMVDAVPDEAIPQDYDGPWPEDQEERTTLDEEITEAAESLTPWHNPMEGLIFCSHDNLPMILLDGEFVCAGEYLYAHLDNAPVTDLLTDPVLTLVFQNGHTLPLLCPDCGDSLHIDDQSALLDSINGLTIIALEWDEETDELILEFGRPEDNDDDEAETLEELSIHLNSVRGLTCPHQTLWHEEHDED